MTQLQARALARLRELRVDPPARERVAPLPLPERPPPLPGEPPLRELELREALERDRLVELREVVDFEPLVERREREDVPR